MNSKTSWLRFARYGWFLVAFAAYGSRDMCLGGGDPPPDPEPTDSGAPDAPSDATPDGAMSLRAPSAPRALPSLAPRGGASKG